jgi:glycosyltransferase involved in cell wall biosynthesis
LLYGFDGVAGLRFLDTLAVCVVAISSIASGATMRVSVIIPTFNRASVLRKTLRGYAEQAGDHQICEILVVDDGSKDDTALVAQEWNNSPRLHVRYLKQENRGLSAARNHGIREAKGGLLLFGDDDIVPSGRMVAEHVAWHRLNPQPNVGVLGLVNWAPEVKPTPFMRWAGLYGPQFNFGYFRAGMELDFRHAYFCNTSVKASFLAQHGTFCENFRQYGWEDLELSCRLGSYGYRVLYNPEAVGYHYKFETFEDTRRRIEMLYSTWPVFAETDAGQRFLELWHAGQKARTARSKTLTRLVRLAKSMAMPAIRPLMDARIPLPHRVYDMVFYSYVTPFSNYVGSAVDAHPSTTQPRALGLLSGK